MGQNIKLTYSIRKLELIITFYRLIDALDPKEPCRLIIITRTYDTSTTTSRGSINSQL